MKRLAILFFVLASAACTGSPVRSTVGGKSISFSGADETTPYTVLDYVQDGLVACFDGIENVGVGEHDSSATTWVDLVSGIEAETNGTGVAFSENSALFDGYGAIMSETHLAPCVTDFSVEVVVAGQLGGCIFSSCLRTVGYTTILKLDGITELNWGIGNYITTIVRKGTMGTTSLVADGNLYSGYHNGIFSGSKNLSPGKNIMSGKICVAMSGYFWLWPSQNATCEIYAIRVYNRPLSVSEIAWNYTIDKVRFRLP